MARVLVTGGAGFIGSHIVEALLTAGHHVRVIDNFSTGRRENLAAVGEDVELVEGDIRSYERAHAAADGMEFVIHLAALPSVPRSVQDPLTTNAVNVTGTLNVVLAARDAGVKKVVVASSSSVYGRTQELPKSESLVPSPVSPYGVSKLAAEQYCMSISAVYGISAVALRYFNVFGPRQDPTSQYSGVVPLFVTRALAGRKLVVYGDGLQSRDFTYVANVVDATLAAMQRDTGDSLICNVGCGSARTIGALAVAVGKATRRDIEVEYREARPGDIVHSYANISAAQSLLGYCPTVDLDEGLMRTVIHLEAGRHQR